MVFNMDKLFIATNNDHKKEEINIILKNNGINIELFSPKDFNDHDEPIENGLTYKENAYIKAKYYYDKYHLPTLADDSGLSIKYFNDLPGIHSARFLKGFNIEETNEYIIDLMKYVKNRDALFECWICFINNDEVKYYQGLNPGEIALEPKGNEGFGYDPIFLIKEFNKTEAELGNAYKNEHSHRAKALKAWVNDLEK